MGWMIDCREKVRLIDGTFAKGANDNNAIDRSLVIEQALRARNAALGKGLWSLADLFEEWAGELHARLPAPGLCLVTGYESGREVLPGEPGVAD